MTEDKSPENNLHKSSPLSKSPQKKDECEKKYWANRTITIICIAIISFIGINFFTCNFMVPGAINSANVLGGLKNPPPLDCKKSEETGYETLKWLLTTVIALATKMND